MDFHDDMPKLNVVAREHESLISGDPLEKANCIYDDICRL